MQNRVAGKGYDQAGNMTSDGSALYTYDTENRLATAGGVTYTYDGDGKRVKKSSGVLYWTGTGSDALVETNTAGVVQSEYIFFNGKRIARIDAAGTVNYYFADHLGTSRVMTTATGDVCYDADYYPWGREQHVYVDTCPQGYKFTGKERDTETGLDYFGARYYGSNIGRFTSPDEFTSGPIDAFGGDPRPPGPLPYANAWNPQSLNKYTYALNSPTRFIDPDGHKAGDKYKTKDQAGVEAAQEARQKTQKDKKRFEYGGRLYKNADGTYSYTKPKRGETQGETTRSKDPKKDIPKGTENAGVYHSHPAGIPHTSPEQPSSEDRTNQWVESALAQQQGDPDPIKPEYIGTPTQVLRFTPDIESTNNNPRGTPGEVHSWNPATQTWTPVPEQSWH